MFKTFLVYLNDPSFICQSFSQLQASFEREIAPNISKKILMFCAYYYELFIPWCLTLFYCTWYIFLRKVFTLYIILRFNIHILTVHFVNIETVLKLHPILKSVNCLIFYIFLNKCTRMDLSSWCVYFGWFRFHQRSRRDVSSTSSQSSRSRSFSRSSRSSVDKVRFRFIFMLFKMKTLSTLSILHSYFLIQSELWIHICYD